MTHIDPVSGWAVLANKKFRSVPVGPKATREAARTTARMLRGKYPNTIFTVAKVKLDVVSLDQGK